MKPIHFPPEPDWTTAKAAAINAFEKHQGPRRLVMSNHWASEGYWIEFEPYKPLDVMDTLINEHKPSREEDGSD